jgi:hypothetical protein
MRAVVHLVKPQGRPNFYLHSAFPWLATGAPARLTVYGIHTDGLGLEGYIEAGFNSRSITFFDPLFALNKDKYRVGVDHTWTYTWPSPDSIPAMRWLQGPQSRARYGFKVASPETCSRQRRRSDWQSARAVSSSFLTTPE